MLKRFFSFFMFIFLSFLSFFLTTIAVNYIKALDPIMVSLNNNKSNYEVDFVNAVIDDVSIVPGRSGIKIDIDKSYNLMKKYGTYNEQLLVFNNYVPNISISNIYDKYINKGNSDKRLVSFVFKVEDTNYLEEIVYILKEKEVIGTFFIDDEVLLNNVDIIKLLYLNDQNVESLGVNNNYSILSIEKISRYISSYTSKKIYYCYSDDYNNMILDVCSKKKMHTIIPTINTLKYPYYDIKNEIDNGSIIKFSNNSRASYELSFIINYIRQKDYDIVSLKKLLEE